MLMVVKDENADGNDSGRTTMSTMCVVSVISIQVCR